MVTITTIRDRDWKAKNSVVHVNSKVIKTIDEFFNDHKIYMLKTKSKVWGKITRLANSIVIDSIHKALHPAPIAVRYSRTAGCSCGCSPGYIVKFDLINLTAEQSIARAKYFTKNIWIDIDEGVETVDRVKTLCNNLVPDLKAEFEKEFNHIKTETVGTAI